MYTFSTSIHWYVYFQYLYPSVCVLSIPLSIGMCTFSTSIHWYMYFQVFESRTYNNRSAAVSSIASMQLPPLPVGLYDYQLLLYNSTDHSEAFAGQCGFYGM